LPRRAAGACAAPFRARAAAPCHRLPPRRLPMSLRPSASGLARGARTLGRALGLASLAGALATGCAAGEDPSPSPTVSTGLALSIDAPGTAGVAAFRFD